MKFVAVSVNIKRYKIFIPWLFFVIACFVIGYLLVRTPHTDTTVTKEEEVANTIQAVGKLMILPDEVPTVATITDLEKLKGQVFFENAKVGDKILIYVKAQKAILYNPKLNKIVELAPLNTSGSQGLK